MFDLLIRNANLVDGTGAPGYPTDIAVSEGRIAVIGRAGGEAREVVDAGGSTTMSSTDVGDVSWVVPTTGFSTACWAPGTPAHSWQAVAAGGMTIGRKGMLLAARVLAATAWDLFNDPETIEAAGRELRGRLTDVRYEAMLEPGQKPPLDYRNPPR